jgi:uncharacterized UPF0160 family protein
MPLTVGTHSGTFHADDVLAFALLQVYVDRDATVVRTRDPERLATCDVVIDVGGSFDPAARRFDHHQGSYEGPLSSAGMILEWLAEQGQLSASLAAHLRERLVTYVDDVDTGRRAPELDVPCFARIVEAIGNGREGAQADVGFLEAAGVAVLLIEGLHRGWQAVEDARDAVSAAMKVAEQEHRSYMVLDRYYAWKPAYFEAGGADHATDFVLFPSEDGSWKVLAIPPRLGCFEQKRSLPESWAGKLGEELEAATGVAGSMFCHKNRFIAVFRTLDGAVDALTRFGLAEPEFHETPLVAGGARA